MGLFDLLRGRKASPEQRARTSGTTSAGTSLLLGSAPSAQRPRDYASYLNAITISNVYSCASVIANNFAATPLKVLDDDENEVDIAHDAPDLDRLLKHPNPMMNGRKFRQFLAYDLLLCGNSFTALDNMTGLGQPTEMYRLSPAKVRIQRNEDGSLTYLYDVQVDRAQTRTIAYAQNEVLHVALADPRDPTGLYGIGVIEAGLTSFDADRRINELIYNYFDRGGIVAGVLSSDQDIPEDDRRQIISDWRAQAEGSRRWRTALLWQGARYTPVAEPLGSLDVPAIAKLSLDSICTLFGVPKTVLGLFDSVNYRNSQESLAMFWSETLKPLLDLVAEDGWSTLVNMFGDYRAEYEVKEVVDYQMKAQSVQYLATSGAYTVNDLRVAGGYDPYDDPVGDFLCVPTTMSLQHPDQLTEAPAAAGPAEQPPTLPVGGKSAPQPVSSPRHYPAGLLSEAARAEQRRKRLVRHTPAQGALRLLQGAQAEAGVKAAGNPADVATGAPAGSEGRKARVTVSSKAEPADTALVAAAYHRWAAESDAHMWDHIDEPSSNSSSAD